MCTSSPARSASSAAARASSRGASPWTALALCIALAAYYRSKLARSLRRALAAGARPPNRRVLREDGRQPLQEVLGVAPGRPPRRATSSLRRRAAARRLDRAGQFGRPAQSRRGTDAVRACARKAAARRRVRVLETRRGPKRATSWRRDDFPCGARPRVWLQVAGHATELHLEDPQKAMVPTEKVVSLVATYRRNIEAVFCNGCRSAGLAAALAEAGVAAVGWRTDCSDAGAALFATAFYKRAFDQADPVADPNIAPAASAFLGATRGTSSRRAPRRFVAQAPRSPACPTRGGGGSVDIEMDGSGGRAWTGRGPSRPRTRTGRCPCSRCPRRRWRWIARRGRRASRPRSATSRWTGRGAPSARGATSRWTARGAAPTRRTWRGRCPCSRCPRRPWHWIGRRRWTARGAASARGARAWTRRPRRSARRSTVRSTTCRVPCPSSTMPTRSCRPRSKASGRSSGSSARRRRATP